MRYLQPQELVKVFKNQNGRGPHIEIYIVPISHRSINV